MSNSIGKRRVALVTQHERGARLAQLAFDEIMDVAGVGELAQAIWECVERLAAKALASDIPWNSEQRPMLEGMRAEAEARVQGGTTSGPQLWPQPGEDVVYRGRRAKARRLGEDYDRPGHVLIQSSSGSHWVSRANLERPA